MRDEYNRMEISMNMDERCICAHTSLAITTEHNVRLGRAKRGPGGEGRRKGGPLAELAGEPRDYWPRLSRVGLEIRRLTSVYMRDASANASRTIRSSGTSK